AEERQDRVLQRARGDRHLPRDRDAGRKGQGLRDGETGAGDSARGGADGELPPEPDQGAERRRRPRGDPARSTARRLRPQTEKSGETAGGESQSSGEKTSGQKSPGEENGRRQKNRRPEKSSETLGGSRANRENDQVVAQRPAAAADGVAPQPLGHLLELQPG